MYRRDLDGEHLLECLELHGPVSQLLVHCNRPQRMVVLRSQLVSEGVLGNFSDLSSFVYYVPLYLRGRTIHEVSGK